MDWISEIVEAGGEGGGDFGWIGTMRYVGVSGAEAGIVGSGVETATATVGEAVVAASGRVDGAGFNGLLGHVWVSFGSELELPHRRKPALARHGHPGNADGCEKKGIAGGATRKLLKKKVSRGEAHE